MTKAVAELNADGVVGLPTETVYGLAAKIDSPLGLNLIFSTKQRPFFDPLIVHVSSVEEAKKLTTDWNIVAEALAARFWPGPLTLVLPKSNLVSDLITSGLVTVGIRMPNHPIALELIKQTGVPLAAPSANRFGRTSPTTADHVESEFGGKVLVLDGGSCNAGIESTIVGIQSNGNQFSLSLLRLGVISKTEIESVLLQSKCSYQWQTDISRIQAPGQMKHHYMPAVPFVILCQEINESEALIEINKRISELPDEVEGVKLIKPKKVSHLTSFELPSQPEEAARRLYSNLRLQSETANVELLIFKWDVGLYGKVDNVKPEWAPIMDRLLKAASLRI